MTSPLLSLSEVDRGRRRLRGAVFTVLVGLSCLAVFWSLFGPSYLGELTRAPEAARLSILGLTCGFIALVHQRDRQLTSLAADIDRRRLAATSFQSRLEVIETLVDAPASGAAVGIREAMRVVGETASELVGALGASVEVFQRTDGAWSLAHRDSFAPPGPGAVGRTLRIALPAGEETLATLSLVLPVDAPALREATLELLAMFAEQSGRALEKTLLLSRQRALIAELEARHEARSRLLSTVSHELRTPLASVIGYAATLENHWDRVPEDRRREFVSVIHVQGNRLARVIGRMLDAARVEMEEPRLDPVQHDVRRSVEAAVAQFSTPERARLDVSLPTSPTMAVLDPWALEQVASNLIDNALKFSEGPVKVSLERRAEGVGLTVADRGAPLDPQMVRPDARALDHPDDERGGTGLGLRVVAALIARHAGTIDVDNHDAGKSITVFLPRGPSRDGAAGAAPPEPSRMARRTQTPELVSR